MPQIIRPFAANHFTLHDQQHHHPQLTPKQSPPFSWLTTPLPLRGGAVGEAERCWCLGFISLTSSHLSLSTTSSSPINPKTTFSISMANYSPPSSGNHRSLFVKPAKRGKQRAGGEALFPFHHFTFNYQLHYHPQLPFKQPPPFPWLTTPLSLWRGAGGEALFALYYFLFYYQPRHPHNCFISQLCWYCAIIPMDEFCNINVLTMQLGTSCSFDSPGLARNEPTPGKRSQGDSTP